MSVLIGVWCSCFGLALREVGPTRAADFPAPAESFVSVTHVHGARRPPFPTYHNMHLPVPLSRDLALRLSPGLLAARHGPRAPPRRPFTNNNVGVSVHSASRATTDKRYRNTADLVHLPILPMLFGLSQQDVHQCYPCCLVYLSTMMTTGLLTLIKSEIEEIT